MSILAGVLHRSLEPKPGIDPSALSNKEKSQVVGALRHGFPFAMLLKTLKLPRSTFYYQRSTAAAGDKYTELRERVSAIFEKSDAT